MNIDWFRWGPDPWIIEHPIFGWCLIIGVMVYLIYLIKVIVTE